ncbi:TPA: DNA-directed RNA polymerase [Candidatus Bathyarchaeota archaeon]|nr:DNA-directed RNA polymerase [Candidatus Bathyarchaeota archaeon]
MFKLVELEGIVRIPPRAFGKPLKEVALKELEERYVGMIDKRLGYVTAVVDVDINPVGRILLGDGASYHKAAFTVLTFYPELKEIIEGEVTDIMDFGAFVRLGPIDAILHVSQVMDDFITYDERTRTLIGKETRRRLSVGDNIRVRITVVSFSARGAGKIGLTARQPFLGKAEWIRDDLKKLGGVNV